MTAEKSGPEKVAKLKVELLKEIVGGLRVFVEALEVLTEIEQDQKEVPEEVINRFRAQLATYTRAEAIQGK